jgi:hypothetical protein
MLIGKYASPSCSPLSMTCGNSPLAILTRNQWPLWRPGRPWSHCPFGVCGLTGSVRHPRAGAPRSVLRLDRGLRPACANPSLCHVAGKHFKLLESAFVAASRAYGADEQQMRRAITAATAKLNSRGIRISVIAKPLDAEQVARVFMRLSERKVDDRSGRLSDV